LPHGKGGRGGGITRFSDVTGSESYPGAVIVTDNLRPEMLLKVSAFSFMEIVVKCRDSLQTNRVFCTACLILSLVR
jgi:hypothetical protein